jgi:hypothetical protein
VSTRVLHHYLFDGTLADEDVGRVGQNGEWVPVVDLRRMFEEDGFTRAAAKEQARQAASNTSERPAHSAPRAVPHGRRQSWLSRQFGSITGAIDFCAGWIADFIVGAASLLMKGLRLRSVQVVLACVLLGAAVWGVVLPNLPISAEEELATYRSLFDEISSRAGSETAPAEWDALSTRLTERIDETGPRIRASATSLRPDFQNLMWAIDLFPKALAEARSGEIPEASVMAMVDRHLEQAERFMRRQASLARRKPPGEPRDVRRIAAVIITPVIAGVIILWRRRMIRSQI